MEEFDGLLGVKADEIIKNRDLIRWCKQNFQNLHFFDSEEKLFEKVSRCGRSSEDAGCCSPHLFKANPTESDDAIGGCVTVAGDFEEIDNVDSCSLECKEKSQVKDGNQLLGNMIKTAGEVAVATVKYRLSLFNRLTVYGSLIDYKINSSVLTYKLCLDFVERKASLVQCKQHIPIHVAIARIASIVSEL